MDELDACVRVIGCLDLFDYYWSNGGGCVEWKERTCSAGTESDRRTRTRFDLHFIDISHTRLLTEDEWLLASPRPGATRKSI